MHPDVLSRFVRPAMANWWRTRGMWWVLAALLIQVLLSLHRGIEVAPRTHVSTSHYFREITFLVGWLVAALHSDKIVKLQGVRLDGILMWPRFRMAMMSGIPFMLAFWLGINICNQIGPSMAFGHMAYPWHQQWDLWMSSLGGAVQIAALMAWALALIVLSNQARAGWILIGSVLISRFVLALQSFFYVPLLERPTGETANPLLWFLLSGGSWLLSCLIWLGCLYYVYRATRRDAWLISSSLMGAMLVAVSLLSLVHRLGLMPAQSMYWPLSSLSAATYSSPVHVILLIGFMNKVDGSPLLELLVGVLQAALYLLPAIVIGWWFVVLDRRNSTIQLATRPEYA